MMANFVAKICGLINMAENSSKNMDAGHHSFSTAPLL